METVYAVIVISLLGGLYGALYWKNKNTPVPEGCENLTPECNGCNISYCELKGRGNE